MKVRLAAFVSTLALLAGVIVSSAPVARAATNSPLDCDGVVAVHGGYRLTHDTDCQLTWFGNDEFFDLGHHTFVGKFEPGGSNLVLRNGTLLIGWTSSWWVGAGITVSHVTVGAAPGFDGYGIEAGGLNVEHSTFEHTVGAAIDFYYGEGGSIRYSVFRDTRLGVSIQANSGVLIEHSLFSHNGTGVNLWPEDWHGVNNNVIRNNVFRRNDYGITMHASVLHFGGGPHALADNTIANNQFEDNGYSGITISQECEPGGEPAPCIDSSGNVISRNRFTGNGFEAAADSPYGDGVTARVISLYGGPPVPPSDGLAGFTLSRNRADRNADLGFDVRGVTDGGGNFAKFNGNPAQCDGVACGVPRRVGASVPATGPGPLVGVSHS